MSDLDLYTDLITRKLVSSDGGAVTLSPFVLGDQLRCTLRTYERSESGDLRERDLRVRTLRASIGRVAARRRRWWPTATRAAQATGTTKAAAARHADCLR